jgi:peptide/nickel transport system permease protein
MSTGTPDVGSLGQWQLIRLRFARHRLAVIGLRVLGLLYFVAIFAEFFALYSKTYRDLDHMYSPPQLPKFSLQEGLYVNPVILKTNPISFRRSYVVDHANPVKLGFFVKGEPYRLLGLIPWDRHFFGIKGSAIGAQDAHQPAGDSEARRLTDRSAPAETRTATFFMLGGDKYGHDLFSRILYGSRISLSVGLIGIAVSFVLGLTIGGISGYAGGAVDTLIQRAIEILNAFPKLPLWLALGAVMPSDWSPLKTYFGITIVLSLMGWTGLARVVRGKILSLREEDYAVAARLLGASHGRVIFRHLLPGFTSHVIVSLTLTVPRMILGETSLSFLGLGLRPPVVSWGVLLQDCMNMQVVSNYPWLLLPVVFIIATVLCFNFLGDGLRDAADPYH